MQNEKIEWWTKYGEAVKLMGLILCFGIAVGTAQTQITAINDQLMLERAEREKQTIRIDNNEKMAYEIKDSVTQVKGDIKEINANLNSIAEMQKMIYREVKK